jgi:hypothetical protein
MQFLKKGGDCGVWGWGSGVLCLGSGVSDWGRGV